MQCLASDQFEPNLLRPSIRNPRTTPQCGVVQQSPRIKLVSVIYQAPRIVLLLLLLSMQMLSTCSVHCASMSMSNSKSASSMAICHGLASEFSGNTLVQPTANQACCCCSTQLQWLPARSVEDLSRCARSKVLPNALQTNATLYPVTTPLYFNPPLRANLIPPLASRIVHLRI